MRSTADTDIDIEAECRRRALELDPVLVARDPQLAVGSIVRRVAPLADTATHAGLVRRVVDRLFGLGPLESLLAVPDVTEIMVNGPGPIWVERNGRLSRTDIDIDAAAIDHLVERIVGPLGRRLDRTSPTVDGRLPDGSRVHIVGPPIALDGPYITVRRFTVREVALEEVASPGVAELLRWAVRARANVVISGGAGSGKTTLLNSLAGHLAGDERIVTIEDAAELQLPLTHVVRMEARPATIDGPPPVTIRDLVRNALRMRPDRIVVGEVRGPEALDMVQAMNTGHDGSLSTCHSNGPADTLRRLASMVLMSGPSLPLAAAVDLIVSAVDVVVHVERNGPRRRVVAVAEPDPAAVGRVRHLAGREGVIALPGRPARRAARPLDDDVLEVAP